MRAKFENCLAAEATLTIWGDYESVTIAIDRPDCPDCPHEVTLERSEAERLAKIITDVL